MFVVVFLVDPKVHVIVPEEFIFNLDEQSLKNVGKNGNFKYKVFYAENCIDENGIQNYECVPNFNLADCIEFPPVGEACYIGKLKRFFSEYFKYNV